MKYEKPLPVYTPVSLKYWQTLKRHELTIQKCKKCNKNIFYPREFCPDCLSEDLRWLKVSGIGKLQSYTVVHSTAYPEFRNDLPIILGFIKLEEGVQMMADIVMCKPENLRVDMEVEIVFDDITEEHTLPRFRPCSKKEQDSR